MATNYTNLWVDNLGIANVLSVSLSYWKNVYDKDLGQLLLTLIL